MIPALLLLVVGCLSPGNEFRPQLTDAPGVYDIGELRVLTAEEFSDRDFEPELVPDAVHYGRLGQPENVGIFGGATLQFAGTGGPVCVIADPEAVFWNLSVSETDDAGYDYVDHYGDDGDIDLSVGLTAYYTGSPGVEIGDFNAVYTDPTGYDHTLEFNECLQVGFYGDIGVHAGRATVEYCEIDTELREGILHTALLETFALPSDDSILNFAVGIVDGECGDIAPSECTFPNEVQFADPDLALPESKAWFPDLESAFCRSSQYLNDRCAEGFDTYPDSPPCIDPDPDVVEDTGATQ